MFYAFAPDSNLGLVKGFYMAVNIGYSIGFGYPSEERNLNYLFFSSIYVLVSSVWKEKEAINNQFRLLTFEEK